jgi:D-alanyl-D-alanine carboxypeptidase
VLTIDNALKIIMVKSANDVALALAEAVGGSEEAFARRMNAEARRLGMTRSHFVNPHGLPDERQVTTARDMALLARALLTEFSHYRSYYNIPAIQYGNEVMRNFNGLVSRYPGTTGLKTGYICSSGFNLVASARRGEHEIVAVVFGTYSGQDRAERAAALLDAGFRSGGLFGRARTTLDNVTSGIGFREPLDMRPEICTDRRREVLEEIADEPEFKTLPGGVIVRMRGAPKRDAPLGPPRDMGPPVRVALGGAEAETRTAQTAPAAAVTEAAVRGGAVPMPRPRPPTEAGGGAGMNEPQE